MKSDEIALTSFVTDARLAFLCPPQWLRHGGGQLSTMIGHTVDYVIYSLSTMIGHPVDYVILFITGIMICYDAPTSIGDFILKRNVSNKAVS